MSNLSPVPKLAELVEHPERVFSVPLEAVPAMRGKLAELDTLLLGRLLHSGNGQGKPPADRDRLLDARETANRLGMSVDYVYKHTEEFPFAVKEGRRVLFSERGLEQYLRRKVREKGLDV